MNFYLNSVNLALFQVLIMSPVVEMGEASIETRESWFPATLEPVLMMIGRVGLRDLRSQLMILIVGARRWYILVLW